MYSLSRTQTRRSRRNGNYQRKLLKKQAKMVRHRELFQGQDDMLSNLAPATVFYRDMKFNSVEQAYQFLKCIECGYIIKATQVLATVNGPQAKAVTKNVIVNRKWRSIRAEILYQLIWNKYENNAHIRQHISTLPLNKSLQSVSITHTSGHADSVK
jgi:predicted NAD-dependent protein-ADP-ribosyltransferase YbiA (DUF1768 family)